MITKFELLFIVEGATSCVEISHQIEECQVLEAMVWTHAWQEISEDPKLEGA